MPSIFISHAAADSEIAKKFQGDVKADFLGMCEVFVSSNLDSISGGQEWNQAIKKNLEECAILIGLLSPLAVTRPWIYTEFGAGWIRGIPTIPVCHSGIERGQLPPPLSFFQGLNLSDELHLDHLYGIIASAIGCGKPQIPFGDRTEHYHKITEDLRIQRQIVYWAQQLFIWNSGLSAKLANGEEEPSAAVPANFDQPFRDFMIEANKREYLVIAPAGFAIGTQIAAQASIFSVKRGAHYDDLISLLG